MVIPTSPEPGHEHIPEGGNDGNVEWGGYRGAVGFGGNNNSHPWQLPLVWANNNNWWL